MKPEGEVQLPNLVDQALCPSVGGLLGVYTSEKFVLFHAPGSYYVSWHEFMAQSFVQDVVNRSVIFQLLYCSLARLFFFSAIL